MEKEFVALLCNHTRQLVLTHPNGNIVDCKWDKLKHNPDGIIDRNKARLVAKGLPQTHGLDYFETSSPVVKASTIQIVLTITFSFSWSVRQLDVQNVFLNDDLQEQVFMSQPPGFINPQFLLMFNNSTKPSMLLSRLPGHGSPSSAVHFLARDFKLPVLATLCLSITLQVTSSFYLYMLTIFCSPTVTPLMFLHLFLVFMPPLLFEILVTFTTSLVLRFFKLSSALLSWGFQASRAHNSMFIHHTASHFLILLIYVDDIFVTGSNSSHVSSLFLIFMPPLLFEILVTFTTSLILRFFKLTLRFISISTGMCKIFFSEATC
ncbi:hypothetical protein VitviT2T_010032 [Vitis vinifera]|uniref:Reverse transcriptase Ty1/copia-type domain-containing protein n=1 Tax=Vitis vinifera TaxID=29760 RepID=A0ABY9C793_VITVI|nr:hypothetical protein VitviT2T_010032 [Vitis vinifera]